MKGAVPLRFGPYEILGELGAGGMGRVYRAKDVRLQRDVALKILHEPTATARDADRQRRFAQEAMAAGALNHPNIVAVYDVGVDGDTPYLVSELVDGTSLRQELGRGRLALKRLIDIAAQIADGLSAAHDAKIVHRDLKPENVMITRDGRVKILDFGLAKAVAPEGDEMLSSSAVTQTADGLLVGTVPYMSPEQASGVRVDFRSDQFSLGLMVYEMATGTHPFRRDTAVQTLSAIIGDEAQPAADLNAALPTPLRWTIERLLAKEPRDRYASTTDLAADLKRMRDHLSEALEAPALVRGPSARVPWLRWTLAALSLVAAVTAAFTTGAFLRSDTTDASQLKFTPLATDAGYQGAPAWSPDGKTLAYVAEVDGVLEVFTRSRASSIRNQVTHSNFDCHDPFWSPDGTRIYYHSLARDKESLWQISVAGGAAEPLIENAGRAALSPDGKTLVVLRDESARGGIFSLWFSSPPGAEPKRDARPPFDLMGDGVLRFAPDGSKLLVWVTGTQDEAFTPLHAGFWMVPQPNGEPQAVLRSLAGPRAPALLSWLPDSRHIVVVRNDGITPGTHLWLADTQSDWTRPLTVTNANEGSPAAAPDGRQIAFTSEATDFDLVLLPMDGSPARPLLSSTRNELDPAWSPTTGEYAYVTDRSGTQEIWLRNEEGRWEKPIVSDADFDASSRTIVLGAPEFSPDGQRIAYQRFSTGGYRLWISTTAGGPPVRVTDDDRYQDAPTWSPDGNWIAFASTGPNTAYSALAKVPAGAHGTTPVVLHAGLRPFSRPVWSPDGQWILCDTREGLMLISPDGAQTRSISVEEWYLYAWTADSAQVYGLRRTDDFHHFMLAAIDLKTGKERIVNPNVGPIPQANQPIRGFSRVRNQAFATSIAKVRSDIWLLEGFTVPRGLVERVWPFSRGSR